MSDFMVQDHGLGAGGGPVELSGGHHDSKLPLELLLRLQMWVGAQFEQLATAILCDAASQQYLRVMKTSPHPTLVTSPSAWLVCRVIRDTAKISCSLLAYNNLLVREVMADLEQETMFDELKGLLSNLNGRQTSICAGIPEEKLITWVNRKNISGVLLERFANKVVFRERGCSYVMLDTDQADICRSCAMLLSTSSMDLLDDQDLDCPLPHCDRSFKYQGALDKHILKHNQDLNNEQAPAKSMKVESEENLNHIKLEPEINVNETSSTVPTSKIQSHDDNDFLDRLLSEIDAPPQRRRKKKKKLKPSTKDFNCSDCGKAFYFQKNLFTHVVERHGKSVDELPNLATMSEEFDERDIIRRRHRRMKGGKGKPVVCDECGVSFKFASGLYNHRKRMHGDTEKKQCPHCPKEVKSCTLEQHIREEHGTPRFACQFCGKGFYYRSFMLNHQRLHTGEYKECVCDLCGAVYKSVQVLNRHVRNAHQDLRNHKCPHCEKAFHNKQRLERHINSQHTKAKVWPCPVCHTRYDRKDNLRTHIRKNHSNVVNPDTVELNSVDNSEGGRGLNQVPRVRAKPAEVATINPETGEIERPGASDRGCRSVQSVGVAQDLLSLKYGEVGAGQMQYRDEAGSSPDIKREALVAPPLAQIRLSNNSAIGSFEMGVGGAGLPHYAVKLERPEVVMSSSVGGQGVRLLHQGVGRRGEEGEMVTISTPPGLVQHMHHMSQHMPGYSAVFNHPPPQI